LQGRVVDVVGVVGWVVGVIGCVDPLVTWGEPTGAVDPV